MTSAYDALHLLVSLAFVLLGAAVLVSWLRDPIKSRAYLAAAIIGISLVALFGAVESFTPAAAQAVEDVAVLSFMGSGAAMLLFRDSLIAYSRPVRLGALGCIAVITAIGVAADIPGTPGVTPSSFQSTVVLALILAWALCVAEPVVRFAVVSFGVPSVQAARLRSLSVGFAGLMLILVLSAVGGSYSATPAFRFGSQILALLLVPVLYAAFIPPGWLRREWRVPEEHALQEAVQRLLHYSPDRVTLAARAAEWARRLVGGQGTVIASPEGAVWAVSGIGEETGKRMVASVKDRSGPAHVEVVPGFGATIVAGLPLESGSGTLAVLAGPFTPVFGSEEIGLLQQYAAAIALGLDRTRLTERLAALERTKSEFLNLASHELRGPITVIRGYLSMMERGSLGETSPEVQRALPILAAKAEQMNMLVEQMLEAARLEEGRLELKPEDADLREIAKVAVELMRPLGHTSHEIVLDVPRRPVPVEVDAGRIGTIITNLIDNAIKYSPAGGEVRLKVATDDGVGEVSVSDRGVGIAESDLPKLFTRFGRIATPETSHIGGTGLGLYLCRELARLHGGDIEVKTAPGRGSTFRLFVPLKDGHAPKARRFAQSAG